MTQVVPLADADFVEAVLDFRSSAFRLEVQPAYLEDEEGELYQAFLRGAPEPPTTVPELQAWYDRVSDHVAHGRAIGRVRVHDEPPTPYQRFERYLDPWNLRTGETIRYLTRRDAYEVGLLPSAGASDWWLLDDNRLIVLHFDETGRRIRNELVTDPVAVEQAREWRDLAIAHSVPSNARDTAA